MDEMAVERNKILDIHGGSVGSGLRQDIVRGLRAQPYRHLPDLLLWDSQGLKLFDRLAGTPAYYPARKEMDLICKNAKDIGEKIKADGVIVELGSG